MTAAQQLYAALALMVTTDGHVPICGHRAWLYGYSRSVRHACDLPDCDGEGAPCSKKCQAVRAALRLKVEPLAPAAPDVAPGRDLFSELEVPV